MGIKALTQSLVEQQQQWARTNSEVKEGIDLLNRSAPAALTGSNQAVPVGGFTGGGLGPAATSELARIRREIVRLNDEISVNGPREGAVTRRSN